MTTYRMKSASNLNRIYFGEDNISVNADVPLEFNNGTIEYPDVQLSMQERFDIENPLPNLVCEVAYSNQNLPQLHEMTEIYLQPQQPHNNNDIIAFLGIKLSYPIFPKQTFQMLVMLYLVNIMYLSVYGVVVQLL
jgi:hypothetical protein